MELSPLAPPWLSTGTGASYLKVIGDALTALGVRTKDASKCHFPGQNTTALTLLGQDLVILRGYLESDASYAARLSIAHNSWQHAGQPRAVLAQMVAMLVGLQATSATPVPRGVVVGSLGAPSPTVVHWDWVYNTTGSQDPSINYRAETAVGAWNWDGTYPWWRSFLVLFAEAGATLGAAPVFGAAGKVFGDTTYSIGLNVPSQVALLLRQNLMLWKSDGTYYPWIIISFNGGTGTVGDEFSPNSGTGTGNPDGLWGRWGKTVAGVVVASRSSTARYLDGTGTYTNCSEHTET